MGRMSSHLTFLVFTNMYGQTTWHWPHLCVCSDATFSNCTFNMSSEACRVWNAALGFFVISLSIPWFDLWAEFVGMYQRFWHCINTKLHAPDQQTDFFSDSHRDYNTFIFQRRWTPILSLTSSFKMFFPHVYTNAKRVNFQHCRNWFQNAFSMSFVFVHTAPLSQLMCNWKKT